MDINEQKEYMNFGADMTLQEFCRFLNVGTDIMFDVRDKSYVMFMQKDLSFIICEQDERMDPLEKFLKRDSLPVKEYFHYKDAFELVDNFLVNGVPLGDIYKEVKFEDYKRVIWDDKEEEEEYTKYCLSLINSK